MHQNLVMSLLKLFGDSLKYFKDPVLFEEMEEKDRIKIIDCMFVFSVTWSLGAAVISSHRRNFNIWLRRILGGDVVEVKNKGKKIAPSIPESGNHFDYLFLVESMQWKHWTEAGITDINAPISP